MSPSVRLGRVFGIEVSFNWSLVFIFALVVWSLATSIPADVPGRPSAEYLIAGVVGALAFYLCLLAHELAHSLLARRFGVRVSGITLWLFGGVSRFDSQPKSAREEALITGAGPATSLLLALLFYLLSAALSGPKPTVVTDLLGWLAFINLALGLFNLVPAFPLDGGRILSALLWSRTGSRDRGVHQAVRVGRVFALAMIGLGFLEFVYGQPLNGVWIAFLGWFLLSAAGAEEAGLTARSALAGLRVRDAMSAPVITLPDWLTVGQLLTGEAALHNFTTYPVHDPPGALTGVVRLPELVNRHQQGFLDHRLRDVAHPIAEVATADVEEDLAAMLERVADRLQHRVLVYREGQLVGIVSPTDIVRLITLRQARPPVSASPALPR